MPGWKKHLQDTAHEKDNISDFENLLFTTEIADGRVHTIKTDNEV